MHENKGLTFSNRLCFALEHTGVSQAELARRIKVQRQAIQYLCASGTNKSKFAYDIAEALEISIDWLIAGKGDMALNTTVEQKILSKQKVVPILSWDQIESWLNRELDRQSISQWTTAHTARGDNTYALHLKDNAMFPRFDSETIIIVDPSRAPTSHCLVIVEAQVMHDIVFRQLLENDGVKVLYAYNEIGYKQFNLSPNDKILGVMVEAKWSVD